jgi:type I restriction enzyme R subunit
VNDTGEILESFQPYYEQTAVGERVEAGQLYELQARLDGYQVYFKNEVEEFSRVFYKPREKQTPSDHAKMNACIDPAVSRFNECDEETQEEFRKVIISYRNLYAFMSQIIPFYDTDLEKLYSYTRFLLTKLPKRDTGPVYNFSDEVELKYYRLQKVSEGAIEYTPGEGKEVSGPVDVGTGVKHGEKIELSHLIDILNDRFGTEFKPADQLFFDSIKEDAVNDPELRQAAKANTLENFGYVFLKSLQGLFIDRMDQNEDITAKFMNDKDFQGLIGKHLMKQVYEQIRTAGKEKGS